MQRVVGGVQSYHGNNILTNIRCPNRVLVLSSEPALNGKINFIPHFIRIKAPVWPFHWVYKCYLICPTVHVTIQRPLIGQVPSRDLISGLWLVSIWWHICLLSVWACFAACGRQSGIRARGSRRTGTTAPPGRRCRWGSDTSRISSKYCETFGRELINARSEWALELQQNCSSAKAES